MSFLGSGFAKDKESLHRSDNRDRTAYGDVIERRLGLPARMGIVFLAKRARLT